MDQAWRLLTGNNLDVDQHHELITSGDSEIIGTLLRKRANHRRSQVVRRRPRESSQNVDGRTE